MINGPIPSTLGFPLCILSGVVFYSFTAVQIPPSVFSHGGVSLSWPGGLAGGGGEYSAITMIEIIAF